MPDVCAVRSNFRECPILLTSDSILHRSIRRRTVNRLDTSRAWCVRVDFTCVHRCAMQSFVHRKNLEHFRKLLAQTTDEAERRTVLKLLAEEKAKDKAPTKAPNGGQHDP